jgi:hypothetical protein
MAMDDVCPLTILRKTIKLWEGIASKEQAKGPKANLRVVASAMKNAADLAVELAAIEARLGIDSSRQPVSAIQVELVRTDSQFTALQHEAATLRQRVAELEAAAGNFGQTAAISQETPTDAADVEAGNNVVQITESREERILRLRREAGDGPQSLRSGFSLDGNMLHEGRGRFDFPSGRGGW